MIKTNYELMGTNLTETNESEIIYLVKNEDFYENFYKLGNTYTVHLKNGSGSRDYVLFKIKKFGSYWKINGQLDDNDILGNYICDDIVIFDERCNETSLRRFIEKICKIIEKYYR